MVAKFWRGHGKYIRIRMLRSSYFTYVQGRLMEQSTDWVSIIIAIGGVLGTLVTAVATIFLWRVTKVLANETTRMVQAASQPHVVVTIEPNRWSMLHFDLKVDNTGNATAYDISIAFDPPIENGEARGSQLEIPLNTISVLKPGQGLSSYLSEYATLKDKAYTISITWRRAPSSQVKELNVYKFDMADYDGITQLGSNDPAVQIAEQLKKIQENLKPVMSGFKRMRVDTFSSGDRLHERRVSERQRRRQVALRKEP
ncbi:hypothetical protein [Pseudomonas tolaasii]|uniref:hypothetical protein n=1 Tax=Pseudomonas tolaasii TaxID=29442 RepID=UPI00210D2BAC|nr:hypothetical protein [Pseudomonas tolaasii]